MPLFVANVEFWVVASILAVGNGVLGANITAEASKINGVYCVSIKREAVAKS